MNVALLRPIAQPRRKRGFFLLAPLVLPHAAFQNEAV